MRLILPVLGALTLVSGCAPQQQFIPSTKSAVELRAMQTRLVPADKITVMRGVAATLHDLGYRITKADAESGTISGTRATALRLAAVVQPRGADEAVVRANATIVSVQEAQVDAPEFYARNFFEPLSATLQRQLAAVPEDLAVPEAVRPVAELNTAKQREAAAKTASAPASATPATGTPTR
ncbi:hypothetical protein [Paracraurococcus lichenis]|uniref:Lipoprotein n=1 Tax=Paracraurococcus lichenis TaxID=3064888 RepID=A0ABT9DX89_9PROT|nr:hypothetical protein [Paracraurococcus sp. LOR1-02]MDO9708518.1 hypothetical protein [Paracraurococcus sp. LOR1-02]